MLRLQTEIWVKTICIDCSSHIHQVHAMKIDYPIPANTELTLGEYWQNRSP